ncbi:hypothetical protein [Streptomyces sp. NPDC005017]|uniref:hypothetical protein n=1 Tax=Streptomyces sp. NPDC005017 TaxID=3364706 RepID=UPI0036A259CD
MEIRNAITVLGVVAAASVVPLVTAAPAQAGQVDCVNYLSSKGYRIGSRVRSACDDVESLADRITCQTGLIGIGVRANHALEACVRA